MKPYLLITLLGPILFVFSALHAQETEGFSSQDRFSDKYFSFLNSKASSIEAKLDKQTAKYLTRLQKQEDRLQKKLREKDSVLAKELFEGVERRYAQLQRVPENINKHASVYSGHLDSLITSLDFLNSNSPVKSQALQQALEQYKSLQLKLNQSDNIKKYVTERQKILMEKLQDLGKVHELRGFQMQVYYYQAQVREYKEHFEHPSKLETKLMEAVIKTIGFKEFFAKNSILGSLFSFPGGSSPSVTSIPAQGFQTRASVNQAIVSRFGTGPNTTQMLQQNMDAAQAELSSLKNKIKNYSSSGYSNRSADPEMPKGFKPNHQRTKSFFQRLEYGMNVQTTRGSNYFPVTSDLGLSLGYKINDKSKIGLGASYKLGFGNNWSHIKITHQGVGLRSFADWKVKGSFWLSGGYEANYRSEFQNVDALKNLNAWQQTGLVGLSKIVSLKTKFFKKAKLQLMWDFLSYQQVPLTQPVLFRIGYDFK